MKSRLKFLVIIAISLAACLCIFNVKTSLATTVTISGRQILLDGAPFIIKGVGYAPVPICIDPTTTPPHGDYFTSDYSNIYDRDLPLLRQMGANTVRLWGWNNQSNHTDFLDKAYNNGNNPIYVIVTFWMDPLYYDITDPDVRKAVKQAFRQMVAAHKNHPAVLMWSIGNELNAPWMYGSCLDTLFNLIDEMAQEAHEEEGENAHPVTTPLANIDLINTIATYDPSMTYLDIWSVQVYRGQSFGSLFTDYAAVSERPVAILEFGIDAYDNRYGDEYENIGVPYQAIYAEALWEEIEANSDVCCGGSIMAYSDEWWKGKYGQPGPGCPDYDPCFHSTCGYPIVSHPDGFSNEEWWGIMRTIDNGSAPDIMQPRAVYYTLQSLWTVLPDLTGEWTKFSVYHRKKITIIRGKFDVRNVGTQDAETFKVAYYLSDDSVLDEGDTLIRARTVHSLAAGESRTLRFVYHSKVPLQGKFIISIVDSDEQILESDEENNIIPSPQIQ